MKKIQPVPVGDTEIRTASALYLELTECEISRVVASALHTDVLSYQLLGGGLFNTTYLLDTEDCGKVVLRAGPVNRHLLMPFEHKLMEAEAQVYALLGARGIPASRILAMSTSKTVIDRDFMIVRYIPGTAMSQIELTPDDRSRISRDVGKATAKMHLISAPRFGRVADVKNGGGYRKWSDCLMGELADWEKVGIPAGIFSPDELNEIHRLFRNATPFLDEIQEPRLVHTDLWKGNILVRTDTQKPEFGAIIDADRAIWGDPLYEFSSIRWTYGETCFWEGYGTEPSQKEGDRIRCALYTLFDRLLNAYVYLKEYNQPGLSAAEREDALANMALLRKIL